MKLRFASLFAAASIGLTNSFAAGMEWNNCGIASELEYYPGDGTTTRPAAVAFKCPTPGFPRFGFRIDTPRGAQMLAALEKAQAAGKTVSAYGFNVTGGAYQRVYWYSYSFGSGTYTWEFGDVGLTSVLKVH